jgi:hypothetical protein
MDDMRKRQPAAIYIIYVSGHFDLIYGGIYFFKYYGEKKCT